ncbi:MMPL family transporter [Nocardia seriolae]|uniref:MMPL family transporter n=1 Tax=Nocardia seriolae TaxID=37332 RepID=UPI0008FF5FF5|nr:MMPL family transporter [Nocardia seriolae]MTJ60243.1 MMPL family transporter [Nocardia seriolae]MTJ75615.1 MMPL family transporter [Nocardia seriolae]MTJ85237.1 MMPL family transporter [Nocardia seriolae]MTK29232.1 MMPL family transporter [Nocardia seriolae]MTK38173.1 MMPL family transporter [Nocardia seriolae]
MSVYLYRWGKFAFRRKWTVITAWIAALLVIGGVGFTVAKPFQDSFSMPGLPSERATEILDKHFPGASKDFDQNAVSGTYVIAAPAGEKLTDTKNAQALQGFLADLDKLAIVDKSDPKKAPADPIAVTKMIGKPAGIDCLDGNRADPNFAAICSNAPLNVLNKTSPDSVAIVKAHYTIPKFSDVKPADQDAAYDVGKSARDAGLQVELTGNIEQKQAAGGASEMIGIGVALVVMIIAFGAIVAAVVPIVTAIFGVGTAMAIIMFGTHWLTMPSFTPTLASMIGIALSIDYAMFIVSRYKHELAVSNSPEEAAGTAVGTAGSAVIFAGLTVIIALAGLSFVGVSFLTYMGIGGALTATMAVLVAVTLMPALLGAFGGSLFKPKLPLVAKHDPEDENSVTNGIRVARFIGKAPWLTLAASVVLLGLLAAPAANLQLGLPGGDSMPKDTTLYKAYDLQTKGFGEGSNGTLMVAVYLSKTPAEQRDQALGELRTKLAGYPGMDYLTAAQRSEDGQAALFMGVPKSGPNNKATKDLVENARNAESDFNSRYGMEYGITGTTAIFTDVSQALLHKIIPYLSIVAGAAFLLLLLVFRSILVPLTAALGFLLSMAATFGATVLLFQEGKFGLFDPHPLVSFLPIMLIGLVFGLAMDYQVFLVTRMREEFVHGKSAKDAMISGYHHGARVVTSAAIIMISVFSAFMLDDNVVAKSMGFAMAAGVFFDAFIVRMILIPSLLALLGNHAWWMPKWLDRILPDIDVEGSKLTELKQASAPVEDKQPVTVG